MVTVFVQHTSCSVIVMENADPTARRDLEEFFNRLVPEDAEYFAHSSEGSDDMPSHIRMVLTRTSETIPIVDGKMQLGTWQGIFLFEHRDGRGAQVITAYVPLSEMFGYTTDLRSATQGRATSTMHFERYDQAPKAVAEEVIAKVQGVASK